LNNCIFENTGNSSWINSGQKINLSSNGEVRFVFNLNIPSDAEFGTYDFGISLSCEGASESVEFVVEINEKLLEFEFLEFSNKKDVAKVRYLLEELSGIDQEVNISFSLFNDTKKVTEKTESNLVLANSKNNFETIMEINSSFEGNLSLLINLSSEEYVSSIQKEVALSPIGGFFILDLFEGENSFISYLVIGLFLLAVGVLARVIFLRRKLKKKE
jgi:hypothetical protein